MAQYNRSVSVVLGNVATSTANRVLAASATASRYIRSIHAINATAGAITINVGVGAAATLTAANANVAFGLSIPANSTTPVAFFGGKGLLGAAASSVNEIMAFASAVTSVTLTVVYDEVDLT